jgi:hypothetical protein
LRRAGRPAASVAEGERTNERCRPWRGDFKGFEGLAPHLVEIHIAALVGTLIFLLLSLVALSRALNRLDRASWREEHNTEILERLSPHFASQEGGLPDGNRPINPRKVTLAGPVQRSLKKARATGANDGFRRKI